MRSQQIASRLSLLVSLLLLVNLSVFMGLTIPVHASSQNNTVAKMQPDLSFQKDLDVLLDHPEKSDSSSDSSDDNYFGLHNDNPPEPENPRYRECNLDGDRRGEISCVPGSSTNGSKINLPDLNKDELKEITKITIDPNSKLKQSDLQEPLTSYYEYLGEYSSLNLEIVLNDSGLKKTRGAGTQLIVTLQSKDGNSDTATIGLWENYICHPFYELDIGNNLGLRYSINHDDQWSEDGQWNSSANYGVQLKEMNGGLLVPTYYIHDHQSNTLINGLIYNNNDMYSPFYLRYKKKVNDGSPYYSDWYMKSDYVIKPWSHIYVGSDSSHPEKIVFQYDAKLVQKTIGENRSGRPYDGNGSPRIRVMGCLEPTKGGQKVITKQKFINYSTKDGKGEVKDIDVNFSNTEFVFQYAIGGIGIYESDNAYIGAINPLTKRPKGVYSGSIENVDWNDNNQRYLMYYLFDEAGGPKFFGVYPNDNYFGAMNEKYNLNKTGETADTEIKNLQRENRGIGMIWPFKDDNESWQFGETTPTMSYVITASAGGVPRIRNVSFADTDEGTSVKYVHDPNKENPLPEIPLKGQVNSTNTKCKTVKLYYLIDQNQIPKDPTQGNYLTTVRIGPDQHDNHSWEDFPQKGQKACITDTNDLETLATPSKNGHTIYIYGLDDDIKKKYTSRLTNVGVQPNVKVTLCYKDRNNDKDISSPKSLIAAEGDTLKSTLNTYYKNQMKEYLPQRIMAQDGSEYSLVDINKQPNFTTSISQDTKQINIYYTKIGATTITAVPQLDFGDVLLPTHKKPVPIKKQSGQLEITDTTGAPRWELTMAATPFYRVDPQSGKEIKDDKNKLENLLTYQYANKGALALTSSPQEIRRYSDAEVQNASTREGGKTTTDFQKIWWRGKQQIEGPMLLPPKNYSFKNKAHQVKYQSTVTWTLNNSL